MSIVDLFRTHPDQPDQAPAMRRLEPPTPPASNVLAFPRACREPPPRHTTRGPEPPPRAA